MNTKAKDRPRHARNLGMLLLLLSGASTSALAQSSSETPAQASEQPEASQRPDEIVVTAQRRDQRLIDVPIAITALGGEALKSTGALTVQDYAAKVPGLSMQYVGPTGHRGRRDYAIRGIYGPNTVGLYIDDTPVPLVDPQLLDVARVEVLRGPQATLYGSNSMGGTIRFITTQPVFNEFSLSAEGRVSMTDGGDPSNHQSAIANLPLVQDKMAIRLSASRGDTGGFIDNYFDGYPGVNRRYSPPGQTLHGVEKNWNDVHAFNVRAILRYEPVENLTITPSVAYARTRLDNNPIYLAQAPGTIVTRAIHTPESERTILASLNVKLGLSNFDIVSNTGYFDKFNRAFEDTTQFGLGYVPADPYGMLSEFPIKQFSQELRVSSAFPGPINFTFGGNYLWSKSRTWQYLEAPGISANNPTLEPVPDDVFVEVDSRTKRIEKSLFAEVRAEITSTLEATAGIRYYSIDTSLNDKDYGFLGSGAITQSEATEDGFRPRATLSWKPNGNLTFFANYGKGYRPGAPSSPRASVCGGGSIPALVSDTVTNYEVGAKASLFDRRVQVGGTIYRMDWKDVQQSILLPCGYAETQNTGDARSEGIEFEVNANPAGWLSLDASATYTDAKITNAPPGSAAPLGSPIQSVPKWKLSFGSAVEAPISSNAEGFLRFDVSYESKVLLDYGRQYLRPAYALVGARIGVRHGGMTTELYGQNLTNQLPPTNLRAFALPAGVFGFATIRPREVGIRVSFDF